MTTFSIVKPGGSFTTFGFNGTKGIAGSGTSSTGLWYSSDGGNTWNVSNINTGSYSSVSISGNNAIAVSSGNGSNNGILYSINSGLSWFLSNLTTNSFISSYISGNIALAGNSNGIFRSTNGGINWTLTPITTTTGKSFSSVYISGTNGVATSLTNGIWYSTDSGATWNISTNTNGGLFASLSMNGPNGVAGAGNTNSGIWYTTNSGLSWTQSSINTGIFSSITLSGVNAIAGSNSDSGLYYSSNSGQTWTKSNSTTNGSFTVSLNNNIGIAGGLQTSSQNGIWTSSNYGQTWVKNSAINDNILTVYTDGENGFATSVSGIYKNLSPMCYADNTKVLCLIDNEEKYVKITDIKIDTLVKTYKCGYKKVKFLYNSDYNSLNTRSKNGIFKLKTSDLFITGGHSILVDELTPEEIQNNSKYNFKSTIFDKKLLLACSSDKFDFVENIVTPFKLYQLVLENENIYGHYGIYVNDGILSETCSEDTYKWFLSNYN